MITIFPLVNDGLLSNSMEVHHIIFCVHTILARPSLSFGHLLTT